MSQINIMALRHSAFYSPLLMTIAGGYLKEQGLEPHYTVATPQNTVVDNIRNGTCHLAQSAVATSFSSLENNEVIDIVHFAQINERDGFFIAAREPDDAFNWHKLKGKKVLVDHFFQPLAMLNYGLHQQGIALSDLNVLDAGDVAAIEQAFRHGEADYVHLQGPAPQQMEYEGIGYVVMAVGDAVGKVAFSSLCASSEWLQTAMATSFMTAYRQALKYVIEAAAEEIASKLTKAGFFTNINQSVLIATLKTYQQLGCWNENPVISKESYEKLLDVFTFNGTILKRYNYDDLIVTPPG